jgi:hypothetical protein
MLIGSFCPVVSIPIMGSISYVNNGQGDGVFVLIMAVVALVAVFVRRYRLLVLERQAQPGRHAVRHRPVFEQDKVDPENRTVV